MINYKTKTNKKHDNNKTNTTDKKQIDKQKQKTVKNKKHK